MAHFIKNKKFLNRYGENPGQIVSKLQRWIILVLLQKNNGFPAYIHLFCQFFLRYAKAPVALSRGTITCSRLSKAMLDLQESDVNPGVRTTHDAVEVLKKK